MKKEKIFNYIEHTIKRERVRFLFIYVYALSLGTVALFVSLILYSYAGEMSLFILFFPSITLSSWHGGWKAGVVTTLVGTIGVYYFLTAPFALKLPPFPLAITLLLYTWGGVFISFILDMCKKTDLISKYKKREKDYAELLLYLQKENAKAQVEIKARDEFLSIASHELKTPLTSMLLQLQTALHNISSVSLANFSVENLLKMLKNAEQQTKRLSKMINDLLNVSLITTGRLELEREEVDLNTIVKDVRERFSEKIEKENYTLRVHIDGPVVGKWDKLRIEQVVTNLISNAIKYGNGKPIDVFVSKHGSTARLIIKDQGIGIPSEYQSRIFERFERAVSPSEYKGLGIGLYITHQIVKAHGGRIKVDSKSGKGSIFTVELPFKKS